MARVIYKHFTDGRKAENETMRLNKLGIRAYLTDSKFISGRKTGTDVYATLTKRTLPGFKVKHIKMAYI